jgi:3',5'-cyclic AMP phosphodiesterase CpdA
MNQLNFIRVRDQSLSLWQSAVAERARFQLLQSHDHIAQTDVFKHPLSIATAAYVEAAYGVKGYAPPPPLAASDNEVMMYQSYLGHQVGKALAESNQRLADVLIIQYRKYSDKDPGFLSCAVTYAEYAIISGHVKTYNNWKIQGKRNINFGVIDWQLPNDARVGIIGDWGTGMPDAIALLKDMLVNYQPQAIIHLGDIYYSGTPQECQLHFAGIFQQVFDEVLGKGKRIPVFSIPGNHDYYAWGSGYYKMVCQLNNYAGIANAIQPASYFCLRTQDGGWQFLAMDTGYNDSNPLDQIDPAYAGPWLQSSENEWHRDKLKNFNGATILLSHHQVFSANENINGTISAYKDLLFFNPFIYKVAWDSLSSKIAGWIWGHEHNFVLYQNKLFNVEKGRLVGNSAYEELTSSDPYAVNHPEVPYLLPEPEYDRYKLGTNTDSNGVTYYNHGYAIIDFSGRKVPTDPAKVNYYQFPAWGDEPPADPRSSLIYNELFSLPAIQVKQPVHYGDSIRLQSQEGLWISHLYKGVTGNYPTLNLQQKEAINMIPCWSQKTGKTLIHGDSIYLQTTEIRERHFLLAGELPSLYYDDPRDSRNVWLIYKRDFKNEKDEEIYTGEAVYFVNKQFPDQWIVPEFNPLNNQVYLTIRFNAGYYWMLLKEGS